jgi:hypothetical protein
MFPTTRHPTIQCLGFVTSAAEMDNINIMNVHSHESWNPHNATTPASMTKKINSSTPKQKKQNRVQKKANLGSI